MKKINHSFIGIVFIFFAFSSCNTDGSGGDGSVDSFIPDVYDGNAADIGFLDAGIDVGVDGSPGDGNAVTDGSVDIGSIDSGINGDGLDGSGDADDVFTPLDAGWDSGNDGGVQDGGVDGGMPAWKAVGDAAFTVGIVDCVNLVVNNGTPYVAFIDYGNGLKITVMKYNGTNWENVGTPGFTSNYSSGPSIDFLGDTPYIVFTDQGMGKKATLMKFDQSLNPPAWTVVGKAGFTPEGAFAPSLLIDDATGVPYVSFQDESRDYKVSVMKYDGKDWVNVGDPGFSSNEGSYISLQISNGIIYIAFTDAESLDGVVVMKFNGEKWDQVGKIAIGDGAGSYISFKIFNEIPYVAFCDSNNLNKATVLKYDDYSDDWQLVGNQAVSAGEASFTSLSIYGGVLYLGYEDHSNKFNATVLKYDESHTPAKWVQVGAVNLSGGNASWISLDVTSGIPYIAYSDFTNNRKGKATVMVYK